MNAIVKRWQGISLILRILVGLILGAVLGVVAPNLTILTILGDIFVGALKAVAPVLVFVLVIASLANASVGIGNRFRTVVVLYMLTTFLAAGVAVIGSFLFPITLTLTDAAVESAPSGIAEVLRTLLNNMVSNPVTSLSSANYVGILTWAVVFGLALRGLASDSTKTVLQDVSNAISTAVRWVIELAPFGILGLVFNNVSTNGLEIFTSYGRLLALLVGCMLFMALVVSPAIVAILLHRNPYPLVFRCLRESGVYAFFTRSSAANIPVNMDLCERLGLDKDLYSVSIPLGATINMDGTAIYQGVCAVFIASCYGIDLTIGQMATIVLTATLASIGTAGVPGAGMVMLAMVLQSVNIPVEGIALVAGIDRIFDMGRTTINITGDAACAVVVSKMEDRKVARTKSVLG